MLDEPTNHLDLEAIEELEAAITGFAGTVVLVTHDRRFLGRPRPADESLGDALARPSPAEELGQGGSGEAVRRDRGEEAEHRQALAEVDVWDLLGEPEMLASRPCATICREAE
jgi:hypothetical protein